MEQIITKVETMDWTMGETGHFSLTLKPGSYVEIDWGDGHKQRVTGTGESQQFQYSYGKRLPIRAYTVTIMSEEDNAIMEYCHGFIDMQTLAIDASGCPGLLRLDAGSTYELNISGCHRLEELDCRNGNIKELDLSGCTNLARLVVAGSKLKTLNIVPCERLHTLDCTCCYELRNIRWSNCVQLRKVIADRDLQTQLRPKVFNLLQDVLEKNGGNIEYWDLEFMA